MQESDIRLFKTDTEAINWLALEADDAASLGGSAFRSEPGRLLLCLDPVWVSGS